jgi:hypothetical protein
LGVHAYDTAPDAGSPAPFRTEQDTAPVFSVAVYFTVVNASPVQPLSVPLTFTVWTFATFVRPGEIVIVPVLVVHTAFGMGIQSDSEVEPVLAVVVPAGHCVCEDDPAVFT